LVCGRCGGPLDLLFGDFHEDVSGIDIAIADSPYLHCAKCGADHLPDHSRFSIVMLHEQAMKDSKKEVKVTRKPLNKRFEGYGSIAFEYSPEDYFYIPGLRRDGDDGFLTPVFFNKAVLLKYDVTPGYEVKFASATYGTIYADDFYISFGVNKNGRVIMWLGDIAKLPEKEQHYLKSENVPSDHSIASEFYDGQIGAEFTERPPEGELFGQRSELLAAIAKRLGFKVAHLDDEVINLSVALNPPIHDTPKERRHIADTLNKIYVESWDSNALAKAVTGFGGNPASLGSLKRLQLVLQHLAPTADIPALMSPLYVLYDFRVAASHLASDQSAKEKMKTVTDRLGLPEGSDLQAIYAELIKQLLNSIQELVTRVASP
jgi:hypothetical protein